MAGTGRTGMAEERRLNLRARGLKKRYGDRWVVHDVSFEVNPGEVVGLLGPNGAGKTTTFYGVVGLIPLDGGEVFLGDENITHEPMYRRARRGIVYLPQETSIFRRLKVRENIEAVLEFRHLSAQVRRQRVERILEELGLQKVADAYAYNLSGGERRRAEIARALAIDPVFLLLDEPFTGIDPIAVREIQGILERLKKSGLGILITDHNVRDTLKITDRAYIISEGHILAHGEPGAIARDPQVRAVYLGDDFEI